MRYLIKRWWAAFVLRFLLPASYEPYRWAKFDPKSQVATADLTAEFICDPVTERHCPPTTLREMAVRSMQETIAASLFKTDAVVIERMPSFTALGAEQWRAKLTAVLPNLSDRQRRERAMLYV